MSTVIGFTGHRDRRCNPDDLRSLETEYPDAVWVHGGAIGFDTQVNDYAKAREIPCAVIRPNYDRYGTPATHIRNRKIVNVCDLLVACYDGRLVGGTKATIDYAWRIGKYVRILTPPLKEGEEPAVTQLGLGIV